MPPRQKLLTPGRRPAGLPSREFSPEGPAGGHPCSAAREVLEPADSSVFCTGSASTGGPASRTLWGPGQQGDLPFLPSPGLSAFPAPRVSRRPVTAGGPPPRPSTAPPSSAQRPCVSTSRPPGPREASPCADLPRARSDPRAGPASLSETTLASDRSLGGGRRLP